MICTLKCMILSFSMDGSGDSVVPNHWPYTSTTWCTASLQHKCILAKRYLQLYEFKLLAWEARGPLPGQSDGEWQNVIALIKNKLNCTERVVDFMATQ